MGLATTPSNRTYPFFTIMWIEGMAWNPTLRELGYTVLAGQANYTPGCTTSLHCVLPNAILPRSAWSTPAQNLLQYIPLPNQGARSFSTTAYNRTLRDGPR